MKIFDVFSHFATDEALEVQGVWHVLDKASGASIKVARYNNEAYTALMSSLMEENRPAWEAVAEKEGMTPAVKAEMAKARQELLNEMIIQASARTILTDFKNIHFKGKPAKYSLTTATAMLRLRDFRELVLQLSQAEEHYKAKLEDDQAKN